MEKNIKSLSEINYDLSPLVNFYATIISIESEGDGEKRPIKFTLKLEDSGETLQCATWNYDLLDKIKTGLTNTNVYLIQGKASNFGTYGDQVRVGEINDAGFTSNKKILSAADPNDLKAEINQLMKDYIKKDSILWKLVEKLVLNNKKFFEWPAATRIHHAYPGGLAKHSLNVCKTAIEAWRLYSGENLRADILVAGSLLHDIGKITEYNKDGSRTRYGDIIPHSVDGYRIIIQEAIGFGADPASDTDVMMLGHILLSHHGKLEFGAAVLPAILEAQIISSADNSDSQFEAINSNLRNVRTYDVIRAYDGQKFVKWHE